MTASALMSVWTSGDHMCTIEINMCTDSKTNRNNVVLKLSKFYHTGLLVPLRDTVQLPQT